MRTTIMTQSTTNTNDTNNHGARDLHKWAQQHAVSRLSCLDVESWSSWLKSFECPSSSRHVAHVSFFLILFILPFYFDLYFPSSSTPPSSCTLTCTPTSTTWTPWRITCATPPRGATTPTDVTFSLTGYEPNDTVYQRASSTRRVPSPTLLRHQTRT